ncbi:glycoside hydrolase family 1 protein [Xylocopilactobacillus apicola]
MIKLPNNFFWGNSTSSMQTEGAFDLDGKGPSVYDVRPAQKDASDWKVAIDAYHRYPEDIALMKDLGMNFYRFQISWSRVQPKGEGEFNQKGIKFYHDLIDQLLKAGIQPMICLYHFDMPLNQANKYNGFISKTVVDNFVIYAKKMIQEFGDQVKYWLTFNEQNLYSSGGGFDYSGYQQGERSLHDLYQIQHNVALAHAKIANYIHEFFPGIQIGGMQALHELYPATTNPKDQQVVRKYKEFTTYNLLQLFTTGEYSKEVVAFMKENHLDDILDPNDLAQISKTRSDFISFSYYTSAALDSTKVPVGTPPNYWADYSKVPNHYLNANEWGWEIDPTGFYNVIMDLSNRTRLPIFPVENGIGVRESWDGKHEINDQYRIKYHREHLEALKDAIQDGANVIGYLGWGLIDIPSSQGNVDKRYGVVYVNRTNHDLLDLKRIPKESYHWLKQVIHTNGEVM